MLLILGRKGEDCSLKTIYNLRSKAVFFKKSVFKDIRQVIRQESVYIYYTILKLVSGTIADQAICVGCCGNGSWQNGDDST